MARSRNIKPSFFTNDELSELSPLTRLLFIGLWTVCDFKGCLEYRPKKLKIELLPYDDCDIEQLVTYLDQSRFITIYNVEGKQYLKVQKFIKHQNPHPNEKKKGSDIPDYLPNESQVVENKEVVINRDKIATDRDSQQSDRADSLLLIPDSRFLIAEGSAPPHDNRSRKVDDWHPSVETFDALEKINTCPNQFIIEQIAEFKLYWRDRGESHVSWDSKFIKSCAGQWKKHGHDWQENPDLKNNSTRNRSLGDDLNDRSWAS